MDKEKYYENLKSDLNLGEVIDTWHFVEEYRSVLSGEGYAKFYTTDMNIIDDFEEGWKLLTECESLYNSKIAFVVWFNR